MKTTPTVQYDYITEQSQHQRIDNYLFKRLKGVPKSHIYQVLRKGQVRVNGKRVKPEYKLQLNDKVRIPPVRGATQRAPLKPTAQALKTIQQAILLEHEDFIVLNKPVNFAVHGGTQVTYGVIDVLRVLYPNTYVELVHRLDKATSGCLLVAKNRLALTSLQDAWRKNAVEKHYLAVLKGHLNTPKQTVNAPLYKQRRHQNESFVVVDDTQGKPSKTTFTELERYPKTTLVRAQLHTGRMHQIRVHSQYIGHPILGDEKYGDADFNQQLQAKRLYLHAHRLRFDYQDKEIIAEAPWPQSNTHSPIL